MGLVIDLQDLAAPSDKATAWQRAARENFFDFDINFKHKQKPAGRMCMSRAGDVNIATIASVPQHHARAPSAPGNRLNQFFVVSILKGSAAFQQNGKWQVLQPGHVGLYDIDTPYECDFTEEYQIVVLQMANSRIGPAVAPPADYGHAVLREDQGSFVVSDYLRKMTGSLDHLSAEARLQMVGFGIDMIAEMLSFSMDPEAALRPADGLARSLTQP